MSTITSFISFFLKGVGLVVLSRKLWNKPSTYHGVVLLGRALYSYIGKGINGTSDLSAKLNQGIFIAFNNPIFKLSWA